MKEFEYTITDADGIHARPAGELVKLCKEFKCDIKLMSGGKAGDCKKIFSLMSLGVKCGQNVTVTFKGEDEEEAYGKVSSFIKTNF